MYIPKRDVKRFDAVSSSGHGEVDEAPDMRD